MRLYVGTMTTVKVEMLKDSISSNLFYHSNGISIPVGFEVVKKTIEFIDENGKRKCCSEVTENEIARDLIKGAIQRQIPFTYVLMDSWFASKENFEFITKHNKHFIAVIKIKGKD